MNNIKSNKKISIEIEDGKCWGILMVGIRIMTDEEFLNEIRAIFDLDYHRFNYRKKEYKKLKEEFES